MIGAGGGGAEGGGGGAFDEREVGKTFGAPGGIDPGAPGGGDAHDPGDSLDADLARDEVVGGAGKFLAGGVAGRGEEVAEAVRGILVALRPVGGEVGEGWGAWGEVGRGLVVFVCVEQEGGERAHVEADDEGEDGGALAGHGRRGGRGFGPRRWAKGFAHARGRSAGGATRRGRERVSRRAGREVSLRETSG